MKRFNEAADQAELNKYPEPNRDETVFLAVTRNKTLKVLHWRIAWKAYTPQGVFSGYKTLEVKHDGKPAAGSSQGFQFRFSLRAVGSTSAKTWDITELGKLSAEYRGSLVATAGSYDDSGNCIAFTKETIEQMVDAGAFGNEVPGKRALQTLQQATRKDKEANVPTFNEYHNNANNSLQSRRAQKWYKTNNGIFQKLEKSGELAGLLN